MWKPDSVLHNRYVLIKLLGLGGFSEVWQVGDMHTNIQYAIKIFHRQNEEGIKLCREEFLKTYDLEHKHILRPIHFDVCDGRPYIIMPFIEGGTLQDHLHEMDNQDIENVATQIGAALDYIHHRPYPIIHGDVKPDNILINSRGEFLLTDFGVSKRLKNILTQTMEVAYGDMENKNGMTPIAYRAPEYFKFKDWQATGPTTKSDIWSLGMMLYFLKNNDLAFNGEGGLGQLMMMKAGNVSLIEAVDYKGGHDSIELRKMIHLCLALDPKDRPEKIILEKSEPLTEHISNSYTQQGTTLKEKEIINFDVLNKTSNDKKLAPAKATFFNKYRVLGGLALLLFGISIFLFTQLDYSATHQDSVDVIAQNEEIAPLAFDDTFNKTKVNTEEIMPQNNVASTSFQKIKQTQTVNQNTSPTNVELPNDKNISSNEIIIKDAEPLSKPKTETTLAKLPNLEGKKEDASLDKPVITPALLKLTNNSPKEEQKSNKFEIVETAKKVKITYNIPVILRLTEDLKKETNYKKGDKISFAVMKNTESLGNVFIAKGAIVNGEISDVSSKSIEIKITTLYSSGGTSIKTLLSKIFFKLDEDGFYGKSGTEVTVKTNEFKEVLIK